MTTYAAPKVVIVLEQIYDDSRGSGLLFEARTGALKTKMALGFRTADSKEDNGEQVETTKRRLEQWLERSWWSSENQRWTGMDTQERVQPADSTGSGRRPLTDDGDQGDEEKPGWSWPGTS
ncbi:hypothetical protein HPB47_024282 [Ixodes persulcatus]|uniref:Uncharacterized protein n=1 Tax=Ixodes persulcatus TaxID=34615 RepID=A0AC60Q512_IXOPE|nr:hypothetical protein HPB47_024282 [Ixodes persulcatus]